MIKTIKYIGIIACVFFFVSQDGMAATLTADACNYSCSDSYICRRGSSDDKYWPGNRYSSNCGGSCRSGYTCQSYYKSCTSPCNPGNTLCTNNSIIPASSYTCTRITSYNSWTACVNNSQSGSDPNWDTTTSSSSSCSDEASTRWCPSTNGACGTKSTTYNATATIANWNEDSWCSRGTVSDNGLINFPTPGTTTANWSCLGSGGGTNATNCSASMRYPRPTVTLSVTPDAIRFNSSDGTVTGTAGSIVSGKNVSATWNIANYASACAGNGCVCMASSNPFGIWNWTKTSPSSGPVTENNIVTYLPTGTKTFTLNCVNNTPTYGDPAGGTASDTVNVGCIQYDYDETCNRECGDETYNRNRLQTNCSTSTLVSNIDCGHDPCPISSEWKEVRP